jgi:16S rRNA processing protein RimM
MLVELGTCTKPHGIKGGFLFNLDGTESVLKSGKTITIKPLKESSTVKPEGEDYKIISIAFGNKIICYLDGIDDRNVVEAMIPFILLYPRNKFPQLDTHEYYLNDLIGLTVFSPADEEIGIITSHYDNGAQTVVKVQTENEILEVPFVELFFPDVDVKKRRVTMIMPEWD